MKPNFNTNCSKLLKENRKQIKLAEMINIVIQGIYPWIFDSSYKGNMLEIVPAQFCGAKLGGLQVLTPRPF